MRIFDNLPAGGYATEKIAEYISKIGAPYSRGDVESALYILARRRKLSVAPDDIGFGPIDFFSKT